MHISSLLASLLIKHVGGVPDVSSSLLASLLVKHVGGVPDLAAFGPIGGYNFFWAWATGRLAGLGAAPLAP